MTSVHIRTLLAPPNIQEANHNAVFFLNSRFNTLDDLDALENAVAEAEQRDEQLKANLATSQASVDALVSQTREAAQNHTRTAQSLSLQRHSLNDELSYLFNQLTSAMSDGDSESTLLEDIETLHRNLKELQSVKGYVQVIEHALKLSEAACHQIRSSPSAAPFSSASVTEYQSLQEFVSKVSDACAGVEDGTGKQTLNLVLFLEKIRDKCWSDIKGSLSSSLLVASERLGWPMPVDYLAAAPQDRKDFERTFSDLLKLQNIGEKLRPPNLKERSEKDGLYPLQALIQPISQRFKYHFEGTRQTNRTDKPEWYFTHVLNVMHEHRPFMEAVIQPLLSATENRGIVAWREFTLLLFPLLARKLRRSMPSLLPHPPVLAHTIYQALVFDAAVAQSGFGLAGTSAAASEKWNGVSDVILGKEEWFAAWMDGEKQFAEDQYHEIISAVDAWHIAEEEGEGNEEASHLRELHSTNSARRLKALVEQITDRYSPLPHFAHRTRFLINVQIPILENYYGRILASLDAFETLSSAFVRAVPGALAVSLGRDNGSVKVDARRLTDGVEGVQRLCKAWLSARYVEAAMEGWGEELFFLELWTEINRRASLRSQALAASSLPDPRAAGSAVPQETVFEELVTQYRVLVHRAEDMIVAQVCGEVEGGLKAHFAATTSPNPNRPTAADDLALSQTLLGPISLLSTHLTYLRAAFPQSVMTALYRRIAARLAEHILQRQILYRGHITALEGRAIHAECELWAETCQAGLGGALSGGRNRVEAPWLKLLQAGRLVGLEGEVWERIGRATLTQEQTEWEDLMLEITGTSELPREEVQRILKSRDD
ncbi:TIP-1 family-domain-containing protein [Mycena albidolilacea]|uniref:TIP-1 family-domain-containing protein n=1 Tax=Mycena albidolilacea TaxID=1033008 RepID=A0AAD7EZV9_9AGAR|nr:TIP-1 family-domain-containing protein [Mycena albidolilacea]